MVRRPEPTDPFTTTTWIKTHKDFMNLQSDFLSEKRNGSDFQQAVIKLCTQFKSDIQHLDKQLKATNSDISSKWGSNTTSQLFGSIQDPPLEEIETLRQNYQDVLGKVDQLHETVKTFSSSPTDGTPDGVEIVDLRFPGRPDLMVWVEDNLKDLSYPFGVFLDIYSFLARVQCGYTTEDAANF